MKQIKRTQANFAAPDITKERQEKMRQEAEESRKDHALRHYLTVTRFDLDDALGVNRAAEFLDDGFSAGLNGRIERELERQDDINPNTDEALDIYWNGWLWAHVPVDLAYEGVGKIQRFFAHDALTATPSVPKEAGEP